MTRQGAPGLVVSSRKYRRGTVPEDVPAVPQSEEGKDERKMRRGGGPEARVLRPTHGQLRLFST